VDAGQVPALWAIVVLYPQTNMARSNRLVIIIKNVYTLWGRKRFLLPVTYFPMNLLYPFTLRRREGCKWTHMNMKKIGCLRNFTSAT